jgi:four helix bundle protein
MAPAARNFRELIAWQLAIEQSAVIFRLIQEGPPTRDRDFCDQIRAASGKVAPLIAEGFVRFTPREFAKYLRYAKAEIAETQTWLVQAEQRRYFTDDQLARAWRISKRTMKATCRLLNAKLRQIEAENRPPHRTHKHP